MKLLVLIAAASVLSGCVSASRVDYVDARVVDFGGGNAIYVVEDPVTQSTCFAFSRGGVNCTRPK